MLNAPASKTKQSITQIAGRSIFSALVAITLLWSGNAQAIYLDFADFRGSESGHQAEISIDGYSITVSSRPTRFDLTISNSGLGVGCRGRSWRCRGNSRSQIDAEWNEQITITFNDGPVSLDRVLLSRLYRGEVAVIGAEALRTRVAGTGWRRGRSTAVVDMGGILVSEIRISARGWFSDLSVRGLVFDRATAVDVRPGPRPTHPVPEPHAALLFAVGLGVVASRRQR